MKIEFNKNGRKKSIHMEYPGSYWEVLHNSQYIVKKEPQNSISKKKSLSTLKPQTNQ